MTTIDIAGTSEPALAGRYTVEELAVIANLYELDALPGLTPVALSDEARGQATRTLLARDILIIRDDDALEVTQPHATFLATLFEAPVVIQVSQIAAGETLTSAWFDWGDECVGVHPEDEGTVYLAAYKGSARDIVLSSLHAASVSTDTKDIEVDLVVELVTTTRHGDEFTVEQEAIGRAEGQWYQVHRT